MAFQRDDYVNLNRGGSPATAGGVTGTYFVERVRNLFAVGYVEATTEPAAANRFVGLQWRNTSAAAISGVGVNVTGTWNGAAWAVPAASLLKRVATVNMGAQNGNGGGVVATLNIPWGSRVEIGEAPIVGTIVGAFFTPEAGVYRVQQEVSQVLNVTANPSGGHFGLSSFFRRAGATIHAYGAIPYFLPAASTGSYGVITGNGAVLQFTGAETLEVGIFASIPATFGVSSYDVSWAQCSIERIS